MASGRMIDPERIRNRSGALIIVNPSPKRKVKRITRKTMESGREKAREERRRKADEEEEEWIRVVEPERERYDRDIMKLHRKYGYDKRFPPYTQLSPEYLKEADPITQRWVDAQERFKERKEARRKRPEGSSLKELYKKHQEERKKEKTYKKNHDKQRRN